MFMDEPQILCGHDHAGVLCQNVVSPVETVGQSSTVVVSHRTSVLEVGKQ
jgi:hypothetical protein